APRGSPDMSDREPVDELTVPEPASGTADGSRRRRRIRTATLAGVAVVLAGIGAVVYQQVKPVVDARRYATVTYEVPVAPQLTPEAGETLLRIDPTRSSLTYEIDEKFAGRTTST